MYFTEAENQRVLKMVVELMQHPQSCLWSDFVSREVVTRRTVYLLRKARERAHILEGLAIALANIDPVIEDVGTAIDNVGESVAERRKGLSRWLGTWRRKS